MIFFQGDEDAVVPPNQTEAMVDGAAPPRQAGRLFPVLGRAARISQGREHPARLDAELYFYAVEVFRTGLTF